MRRIEYQAGPIKVLVDLPEEIFQELKKEVPQKLRQSIAVLAVQALNHCLRREK